MNGVFNKNVKTVNGSTIFFIGKVRIAGYFYNGLSSKDDVKKYQAVSYVPSLKDILGNFETEAEAERICKKAVEVFISQLYS